jgi:hypothetical protein
MAFTVTAICSLVMRPGACALVLARKRASAASFLAWVSVIH